MAEWFYFVAPVVVLFVAGLVVGLALDMVRVNTLKQENERLNTELKNLTDRDSRGRFVGKKK